MNQPIQYRTFEEMPLSPELKRAAWDLGFEEPTPIQSQTVGLVLEGRDVIAQSQTGTGKTAAFGMPILEQIDPDEPRLQALILCPTRELAIQVGEEFRKFLKYKASIKVLPVYGGQPINRQILALKKGVQVIIGTPGRVMDHLRRHTLKMDAVRFVVLDEADEMLDMGFREDMEDILSHIPHPHQTLLFSATMSGEIMELAHSFLQEPEICKVAHRELTVPSIDQAYFDVKARAKTDLLCRLLDLESPRRSIVFCNTKKRVDELVEQLQARGYFAEALHGDLKQPQRDSVMQRFRSGSLELLVATDVAARGLDVDNVDVVFNYDIPQDEEFYVHRIGRTGRAGKDGKAYSFVTGKEIYKLRDIMRYTKASIPQHRIPTLQDVEEAKTNQFLEQVRATIQEGRLAKYVHLTESLLEEDYSTLDIAAALFKLALPEDEFDEGGILSDGETRRYGNSGGDSARLFLSVGKKDKLRAKDVVGALAGETGIPGNKIGSIEIYDEFSFVDVPEEYVAEILQRMKSARIKGKKVTVELAKKERRRR